MNSVEQMSRKPLSSYSPILYFLSVWTRRAFKYFHWHVDNNKYAQQRATEKLPARVKKHSSLLIRKLGNTDLTLQYNKITNLHLAAPRISGIMIKPGETFSFYRLVGLPTKRKGYLPGLLLSNGEAKIGIAGGICQLANLIHWLVIHSPLTVTERHHHTFDPFPDDRRVIPFGTGATVFYNYIDYRFTNNTPYIFQIILWLSEKSLEGELRVDKELDHSYHVFEKEHQFLKIGDTFYRKNEIWREKIDKATGNIVEKELVTKNFAQVKYIPDQLQDEGS